MFSESDVYWGSETENSLMQKSQVGQKSGHLGEGEQVDLKSEQVGLR
jgi:hypothetical protein